MITGSKIDKARLINLVSIYSTKIQALNYDLFSFLKYLQQLSDPQLKALFTEAGDDSATADGEVTDIRSWQVAVLNLAQNFTGTGTLNDASFEVSKRYDPLI